MLDPFHFRIRNVHEPRRSLDHERALLREREREREREPQWSCMMEGPWAAPLREEPACSAALAVGVGGPAGHRKCPSERKTSMFCSAGAGGGGLEVWWAWD